MAVRRGQAFRRRATQKATTDAFGSPAAGRYNEAVYFDAVERQPEQPVRASTRPVPTAVATAGAFFAMGIKFYCPSGHRLHVKESLAGRRGVCPHCGEKVIIPVPQATAGTPPRTMSPPSDREEAHAESNSAVPADDDLAASADGPAERSTPPTTLESQSVRAAWSQSAIQVTDALKPVTDEQNVSSEGAADASADNLVPDRSDTSTGQRDDDVLPSRTGTWLERLEEAPEARWYVRLSGGQQFGPAQADIMATWLRERRIPGDAWVWREGWADWKPVGEVFGQSAVEAAHATTTPAISGPASTANNGPQSVTRSPRQATEGPAADGPFTLRDVGDVRMQRLIHQQKASRRGLLMVVLLALVTIVLFSILLYVLLRPPGRGESAVPQAGFAPPTVKTVAVAGMGRPVG